MVSPPGRAPTFDQITPIEQEWLWPGYIPFGLVTVVIAEAGTGKTFMSEDLVARVSRGDAMPDGSPGVPAGNALLCALEDSSEFSTVHRLAACKAQLKRVIDGSGGADGEGFELTRTHQTWLRQQIAARRGVSIVVIDTLSAATDRPLTSVATVRRVLKPLTRLAAETGAAVVVIAHTRKDGKAAGSQALIDVPRQVLMINRGENNPDVRTITILKSNVATDAGQGVSYTLAGAGKDTHVEYTWDADRSSTGPAATGQARILMLLRSVRKPLAIQEIVARTGIKYTVAGVLLGRMVERHLVARESRGTYYAVAKAAAA